MWDGGRREEWQGSRGSEEHSPPCPLSSFCMSQVLTPSPEQLTHKSLHGAGIKRPRLVIDGELDEDNVNVGGQPPMDAHREVQRSCCS